MITRNDVLKKLSSRKFWAALLSWVTSVLTAFNVSDSAIAQVSVIVAGIGALVVYLLAETSVDIKRVGD